MFFLCDSPNSWLISMFWSLLIILPLCWLCWLSGIAWADSGKWLLASAYNSPIDTKSFLWFPVQQDCREKEDVIYIDEAGNVQLCAIVENEQSVCRNACESADMSVCVHACELETLHGGFLSCSAWNDFYIDAFR